jgi:hypothetical protein
LEFLIDDGPFSINNGLIIFRFVNSNFRVFLFGFKFQFKVQ